MAIINGTPGDNGLIGTSGDDTINGGDGNDVERGRAGNDTLNGDNDHDFLVGGDGDPTKRGVVSTASYEAREDGVRSGMPLRASSKLLAQLCR